MMPKLELTAKNLHGTIRYFPACPVSEAIVAVRGQGKKTLLLEHINALNAAGFPIAITDWRGEITEL
jgi:alpha-beta hydrolase superfamily lysophospholipase